MKGDKGRKKTWFKLGHEQLGATETHHTNQVNTENHYIWLPRDQHDALIEKYNNVISISDVDGKPCNVKLLRPKPAPPTYIERLCEPHGEDGKVKVCGLSRLRSLNNCDRTLYKGIQNQNLPVQAPSSLTKTARDRWASAGRNASNATLVAICQKEKSYTMKWTGVEEVVK